MFDWPGLSTHKYFLLIQTPNPLKHCNFKIPIPLGIGLPFMPCDLPNEYTLHQTDSDFTHEGDIYLTFQQQVSTVNRILIPSSHRPWSIIGKDYYQHTPYMGIRDFNLCCQAGDRPQVRIFFKEREIGRIIQKTILNCCCFTEMFQEFQILNQKDELVFRVVCRNPQRGQFGIFPCWGFDKITYDIMQIQAISQGELGEGEEEFDVTEEINENLSQKNRFIQPQLYPNQNNQSQHLEEFVEQGVNVNEKLRAEEQYQSNPLPSAAIQTKTTTISRIKRNYPQTQPQNNVYNLMQGQKVGQIVHLWNGIQEYISKNDRYGIQLPDQASQEQKCMLVYCTLFIDYLLFENF